MYYLRKEPYEMTMPEIMKTDGTVIPEKKYMTERMAVYKHPEFARFYRGTFTGIDEKYQGMRVYTCKKLKTILKLRQSNYDYSGQWFDVYDVYDENGLCIECAEECIQQEKRAVIQAGNGI